MNDTASSTSPDALRQALAALLGDPGLDTTCARHFAPPDLAMLRAAAGRLTRPSLLVALIGPQGAGKSTLFDALVGRELVSVHEDESTNAPTLVSPCGPGEERIEVHFQDGRVETVPLDLDVVERFTTEQRNPGNALGVERVHIHLEQVNLPFGASLCDTNGLNSLKTRNHSRTLEFMAEAAATVLVIPSVPAMTRSDYGIVLENWQRTRDTIFVLNVRGDDGLCVEQAVTHTRRVLQGFAEANGDSREIQLFVVDANEAREGVLHEDTERVARSGLPALIAAIGQKVGADPIRSLVLQSALAVDLPLLGAGGHCGLRVAALDNQASIEDADFHLAVARAQAELAQRKAEWVKARSEFTRTTREARNAFEAEAGRAIGDTVHQLCRMVDNDDLKPKHAAEVAQERLKAALAEPGRRLNRALADAVRALAQRAESVLLSVEAAVKDAMGAVVHAAVDLEGRHVGATVADTVRSAVASAVMGVVGAALVGGIAEALFAGAALGEALAAGLSAIPVVGVIVGAVVVGLGWIVGWWLRGKIRRKLNEALRDAGDTLRRSIAHDGDRKIADMIGRVEAGLDHVVQSAVTSQQQLLAQMQADRQARASERDTIRRALTADRATIDDARAKISSMVATLRVSA